jgi:hypothetical protein
LPAATILLLPGSLFVTGCIAVYALLPAAPIIICAELAKIRSPLFCGPAGVAVAALTYAVFDARELVPVPAGAVGGLGGGLTYWRFAGRGAGRASAAAEIRNDEKPSAVLP